MESAENGVEAATGGVDVRIAEELIEQARKDGGVVSGPERSLGGGHPQPAPDGAGSRDE